MCEHRLFARHQSQHGCIAQCALAIEYPRSARPGRIEVRVAGRAPHDRDSPQLRTQTRDEPLLAARPRIHEQHCKQVSAAGTDGLSRAARARPRTNSRASGNPKRLTSSMGASATLNRPAGRRNPVRPRSRNPSMPMARLVAAAMIRLAPRACSALPSLRRS